MKYKVSDIASGRNFLPSRQPAHLDDLCDLPDVPVLPETLLMLELMSRESSVDLREISQLFLGDVGACLQLMRLAGREFGSVPDRPERVEDCISALGLDACLEAVSHKILARKANHTAAIDIWTHSKSIADRCAFLAEETSSRVSSEEAYLIGLLHELGSLPAVLGWEGIEINSAGHAQLIPKMAEAWCLPQCVTEYLSELSSPGMGNRWTRVVQRAHRLVSDSPPSLRIEPRFASSCAFAD